MEIEMQPVQAVACGLTPLGNQAVIYNLTMLGNQVTVCKLTLLGSSESFQTWDDLSPKF